MSKAFIKNTQRKDEVESIHKVEHPTNGVSVITELVKVGNKIIGKNVPQSKSPDFQLKGTTK